MKRNVIRFIQTQLNARGLDAGPADGRLGPNTRVALDKVEDIPSAWSGKRKAVAFVQLLAKENDIETGEMDGYWGPQTEYAFEVLERVVILGEMPEIWRPEELPDENPNGWPRQSIGDNLMAFFGNPGEHQTIIELPYPHRLAWNKRKRIHRFQCHEKVHDSLLRVLVRVLDVFGVEDIRKLRLDLWGGCFNVRKMRGGTRRSLHSWGIAVDYDPERNKLKWGRDRAAFARTEYDVWWRLWEEEGWVSLGRHRNFDWMHIQAAKL
jgi:hypothetical protein